MKFTDKEYLEALGYVQGMFSLGGLSECGKTSAGYKLQDMGARKSKIIHIEREMMEERGYDLSQGMKDEHFVNLYAENQDQAFREFLFRLIGHMKEEGKPFASIESLYRAELGAFLKRELKGKMANIFIDAPVEARAKREIEKVNAKAKAEGLPLMTFEEMLEKVKRKDEFKTKHNAAKVKDIADYVVDNSEGVTREQFLEKIEEIGHSLGL